MLNALLAICCPINGKLAELVQTQNPFYHKRLWPCQAWLRSPMLFLCYKQQAKKNSWWLNCQIWHMDVLKHHEPQKRIFVALLILQGIIIIVSIFPGKMLKHDTLSTFPTKKRSWEISSYRRFDSFVGHLRFFTSQRSWDPSREETVLAWIIQHLSMEICVVRLAIP